MEARFQLFRLSPTVLCGLAYVSLASLLVWSVNPFSSEAPLSVTADDVDRNSIAVHPELGDALFEHAASLQSSSKKPRSLSGNFHASEEHPRGHSQHTNGKPRLRIQTLSLKSGDTLSEVLSKAGIAEDEIAAAVTALQEAMDLRRLPTGHHMTAAVHAHEHGSDALCLEQLRMVARLDRIVTVDHVEFNRFVAREDKILHSPSIRLAKGQISSSFYEAAQDGGVPEPVIAQAFAVLGYAVDFQRDLQEGDLLAVGYEMFDDGAEGGLHPGDLLYAALTLRDRTVEVYRHQTRDGYTGFFGADGSSIETSLMKTPVDGGRLSSVFGKRKHPVLGYTRKHQGLDFTAPQGTEVLAAGDGVVVKRGRYGSFGNYVRIKHNDAYATAYAHLSRFDAKLKPGARVRQGQVIGYVGATGLATGPNLHYEVFRNNRQIDPMTLVLPPSRILRGEEWRDFDVKRRALLLGVGDRAANDPGSGVTGLDRAIAR